MKRIVLMLLGVAMSLPAVAQENALWNDAFNISANYSFNVRSVKKDLDYKGVALSGGYRKFLYWGLFVMPEVSLYWQRYQWSYLGTSYEGGYIENMPPYFEENSLNRFGAAADVMLGVRVL